jgi:hypothetical protein
MKARCFFMGLLIFLVFDTASAQAGNNLYVELDTEFRLDPIQGIRGDPLEANSKFVQRFIFSPLVLPLADPYLQDSFEVVIDLSLIDRLDYYQGNQWKNYNLKNKEYNESNPESVWFRVKLRDNLNFNHINDNNQIARWDTLTAEDVVFSYRMARITSDRVYKKYQDMYDKSSSMELNTLLYSKLKSFSMVNIEEGSGNRIVTFTMDKSYRCEQFLRLLAYVPILSATQICGDAVKKSPSSPLYQSVHNQNFNMKIFYSNNYYMNNEVDLYDFNKIDRRQLDRFYRKPVGYGQYLVINTRSIGGNDRSRHSSCRLIKNEEWCNHIYGYANLGGRTFYHSTYKNSKDTMTIQSTNNQDIGTRINQMRDDKILYNVPLAAINFQPLGSETRAIMERAAKMGKRKMQISHNLYGIYFGPDLDSYDDRPISRDIRDFFALFADRSRIENILKYSYNNEPDYLAFEEIMRSEDEFIVSDIKTKRIYYPFYMGNVNDGTIEISELDKFYEQEQKRDTFFHEYNEELWGDEFSKEYFAYELYNDNLREDFFNKYIGGNSYSSRIKAELLLKFNNIRNKMIKNNGIKITIYYIKGDTISKSIALHYKDILTEFFKNQAKFSGGIEIKDGEITRQDWRNRAISNKRQNIISLLVKGWNYKLDLLDELNDQFIDTWDKNNIKTQYDYLVNSSVEISAETIVTRIAAQFTQNNLMIPLVALQNYAVYQKGVNPSPLIDTFESKEYQDIEILLFPYYWRKTQDVR